MYKKVIKPILFLLSPDFVHRATVAVGRVVQVIPPARWLLRRWWGYRDDVLHQEVLGIDFTNPVGLSAGFDKNIELTPLIASVGFGFETGGSVTLGPRRGNPRPWFYRLPKTRSLVVHAGMANKGLSVISASVRRNRRRAKQLPLFISVAVVAKTANETLTDAIIDAKSTTMYILQHQLAQGVEINISCPNVADNEPFTQPRLLNALLTELDKIDRQVPFFVKMPNIADVERFDKLLQVIVRHNIQGVTIANLVKNREEITTKDPLAEDIKGGLSGAPTRSRSLALIRHTYQCYGDRLTIIGVGGVFSGKDAYDKIKAGASLVELITGMIFEGPQLIGRINRDLARRLEKDGFSSISEAVGADYKK